MESHPLSRRSERRVLPWSICDRAVRGQGTAVHGAGDAPAPPIACPSRDAFGRWEFPSRSSTGSRLAASSSRRSSDLDSPFRLCDRQHAFRQTVVLAPVHPLSS